MSHAPQRRGTIYVFLTIVLTVSGAAAVGALLVRTIQLERSVDLVDAAAAKAGARAALDIAFDRSVDEHPQDVTASGTTLADIDLDGTSAQASLLSSNTSAGFAFADYQLQVMSNNGNASSAITVDLEPVLSTDVAASITLGPGLFFPLTNGGSGTVAEELVGGSDGVLSAAGIGNMRTTGNFAPGLELDGISSHVSIGSDDALEGASRTIAFWAMASSFTSGFQIMYSEYSAAYNVTTLFFALLSNDSILVFQLGSVGEIISLPFTLTPGQWFHLAYTTEPGDQKLYINNVIVWSDENAVPFAGVFDTTSGAAIGAFATPTSVSGFFNGSVAGLLIDNSTWNSSQVFGATRAVGIDLQPIPGSFR